MPVYFQPVSKLHEMCAHNSTVTEILYGCQWMTCAKTWRKAHGAQVVSLSAKTDRAHIHFHDPKPNITCYFQLGGVSYVPTFRWFKSAMTPFTSPQPPKLTRVAPLCSRSGGQASLESPTWYTTGAPELSQLSRQKRQGPLSAPWRHIIYNTFQGHPN